ncbi:MAG: RsmB/NOP family class I SAM-dependent RNA methyltransferase, partial [Tannerella sp.]|nr:RsmB/NOP family class I SAM-dependent RNA methyltransferase [Tannerella sp.]
MELPKDFTTRTRQWMGDDYSLLEKALQTGIPISIRTNPAKQTTPLPCERVKWCDTGYYLPERPSFTFDPLFHAGTYYVQEASSMFLEQAIRQHVTAPVTCLDLCAAPGGKSTHLSSLLPGGSLLVSNEVIRSRAAILAENMLKWGSPDSIITNNDPKEIGQFAHLFDIIVADLPCSGEGMFRKDPASRNEWSIANVQLCATRQQRIIHDIWPALKPGGLLIYSTCTFNREENEENIAHIIENLDAEPLSISINEDWRISGATGGSIPVYRFFPHKTKGEGFFLSVLRKSAEGTNERERKSRTGKTANKQTTLPVPSQIKDWLSAPENYRFIPKGSSIQAIPHKHIEVCQFISERLRVISAGIPAGEIKGKDLLPQPALALSTAFRSDAFPAIELPLEDAIRY